MTTRPSPDHLRRGDLRILRPLEFESDGSRIVLVADVDRARDVADVVLVHADPGLATESDVVVPKAVARSRFPVVVQTDLRSVVWTRQLGEKVGRLEAEQIEAINDLVDAGPGASVDGYSLGLPLDGPFDGRWSFKREEGADFRRLSADCTQALLESQGRTEWAPDALMSMTDASNLELLRLVHWLSTRSPKTATSDRGRLVEVVARLERYEWSARPDLGDELSAVVAEAVLASMEAL